MPIQLDQGDEHPDEEDIHHQPGFDPAQQSAEGAQGIAVQILSSRHSTSMMEPI